MESKPVAIQAIILGLAMAAAAGANEARAVVPESQSPLQCVQLGGPVRCKIAEATPWEYRAWGKNFTDEAGAYARLLETYEPESVFTVVHRWGSGALVSAPYSAPRFVRSFETSSWKVFARCVPLGASSHCEKFTGLIGYRRVRDVICPTNYRFSNDAASPYCLPSEAVSRPLLAQGRTK